MVSAEFECLQQKLQFVLLHEENMIGVRCSGSRRNFMSEHFEYKQNLLGIDIALSGHSDVEGDYPNKRLVSVGSETVSYTHLTLPTIYSV